jgi:hypothetical protein
MTISQIADIHRRTPGSISYKLKSLGLIIHNALARGHLDYKNSNLYREIIDAGLSCDAEKKVKKETKTKAKIDNALEMRNEIADLKKDVKEMLRLMNALYDFESQ